MKVYKDVASGAYSVSEFDEKYHRQAIDEAAPERKVTGLRVFWALALSVGRVGRHRDVLSAAPGLEAVSFLQQLRDRLHQSALVLHGLSLLRSYVSLSRSLHQQQSEHEEQRIGQLFIDVPSKIH
jgi:hypothetical protein